MSIPLYFEIQAEQLSRARTFYHAAFGWQFNEVTGLAVEYWLLETEQLMAGLLQRPAATPPAQCGTNAFVCSFPVDDFDHSAARITDAGGHIALEKFAVPGRCWQGYFVDTEGNTFGIYQVDPAAA